MTYSTTLTVLDRYGLRPSILSNYVLGFDRIMESMLSMPVVESNFPKYDLFQDGSLIHLEMPLSGYSKENLKVYTENDVLVVEATKGEEKENVKYLHRGIARRSFTWRRTIPENILVKDALFEDGLLRVVLEKITPERSTNRKDYL